MNKLVLLFGVVSFLFLGYLYVRPTDVDSLTIVEASRLNDDFVSSMGMDPSILLHQQKQLINEHELAYLTSFETIKYIVNSINEGLFYRDWGGWMNQIEFETQSQVELSGNLFIDRDGDYHIMINYIYINPQFFFSSDLKEDYLTVNHSKYYQINKVQSYMYYEYKKNEYEIKSKEHQINSNNPNEITLPKFSISHYFKQPIIKGFVWVELKKDENYESNLFECIVDFYEYTEKERENVVLGFNSFREAPTDVKYIPSSLKVTYLKESD